jgi:hypothetical protein
MTEADVIHRTGQTPQTVDTMAADLRKTWTADRGDCCCPFIAKRARVGLWWGGGSCAGIRTSTHR